MGSDPMSDGARDSLEVRHLRELLQERQDRYDSEITHLRELLDERDKNLVLQAKEYERRLGELNQAHERAEKAVRETVQVPIFKTFVEGYTMWRDEVNADRVAMKSSNAANTRFFSVVVTIVGLIFTAITVGLKVLGK